MRKTLALFAAAMLYAAPLAADEPTAQIKCFDRAEALQILADNYGEHLFWSGLDTDGDMIDITVSDSGSWTMFASAEPSVVCMMDAGTVWKLEQQTSY